MEKEISDKNFYIQDYLSILEQPEEIFTLLYPIGKGLNSIVYKAIHKSSRQSFAIKIINNPDKNKIICLQNQINLMKKLFDKSEYIIKYYGSYYSIKSRSLWIILEYCALGSVLDLLVSMNRPYNEIEISTIIKMILKGLTDLYKNNIIYKNLKSNNILITEDGYSKLSDSYLEEIKDKNNDKSDIFNLGIICIELISGIKINNISIQKKLINKFIYNIKINNRYSCNFIDFLERCLVEEDDKRANIFELSNHPFIIKNSKDRNFLSNLIFKCIENIDEVKNKNNLNYKLIKEENKFYIDKNINNSINNFFLNDNNCYLCKNYRIDLNSLNMSLKKKEIVKNNKYKKNNNLNNNLIYKINNSVKKKCLLIQNKSKKKNNHIKGIYIGMNSSNNKALKNKKLEKIKKNINKLNNEYDNNYITDINEKNLKCQIIKLSPNIRKNSKNYKQIGHIQNISLDNKLQYKKNDLEIKNGNNNLIVNNININNSFSFGNNTNKNIIHFHDRLNTYSKPIIKEKIKKNLFKPSSAKNFKINRILFNKSEINNNINYKNIEDNKKLFEISPNYINFNKINIYNSFDNSIDINDEKLYNNEECINNIQLIEIINKPYKTKKMGKSHEKYFNSFNNE